MVAISADCPWCSAKGAALELKMERRSEQAKAMWEWMVRCPVCMSPCLVLLRDSKEYGGVTSALEPSKFGQGNKISDRYAILQIFPRNSEPEIPNFIPKNVEIPLLEAEHSFIEGRYSAAASCYRKAIERSLKSIDPEVKGMLNARIRSLETRGVIPHTLIELLDQVRLFGNEAMHEDEIDPTKEDCAAARDFCTLFLRYCFTLPAMVDQAKQKHVK
jgi:Domain of unknown function (DUF4145)